LIPDKPFLIYLFFEVNFVMLGEEENVTKDIGHLFVKIFGNLIFGFVFLARTPRHHEIALDQLPHLLLKFEDVPVGVTADTKLFGVVVGDFFDLAGNFVDVHARYYILEDMSSHVAIIYSLPSKRMRATEYAAADEDTEVIAKMVAKGLEARGYTTAIHAISENGIEEIATIKADCIFNLIEWCGQDIELAKRAFAELRKLDIPVTGADERLFVLTGDKVAMKAELNRFGVSTPKGITFTTGEEVIPDNLSYPMIVKPSLEHCSMGLSYDSIAHNAQELKEIAKKQIDKFEQSALAEEFIVGRELLVYLVEEQGKVVVLPIEELVFDGKKEIQFQTYETKWVEDSSDYNSTDVRIAKLSNEEQKSVERECIAAFTKMGFRGYARFDIRLRNGIPYILETNANPSVYDATEELTDIEGEVIWGINFPDYLKSIVETSTNNDTI